MKLTFSNSLIIITFIFTLALYKNDGIGIYAMNTNFLEQGQYVGVGLQFVLYSLLHGDIFHWLFNSIFLYIFGNQLEENIGIKKYLSFFVFSTIFNGISILIFSEGSTIGISGFALALLSYFTLDLYQKGNPEYKGGITAIIINLIIGFVPGISFVGHLFGAIGGIIYYFILKSIRHT